MVKRSFTVMLVFLVAASGFAAADGRCIQQTRYWGGDGPAASLVVVNGHAFFGGHTIRVADLDDPMAPDVVRELRTGNYVTDLAVWGDRVYAVDRSSELTVINASSPASARIAWKEAIDDSFQKLHQIDVHDGISAVAAGRFWSVPYEGSVIQILDVTNPEPEALGSVELPGTPRSLAVGDGFAVASSRSGAIWFIDLSDATAPFVAREMQTSDLVVSGEIRELAAEGTMVAISSSDGRVTLMEVSDPSYPDYLGLTPDLEIGVPSVEFEGSMIHAVGADCTNTGVCGGYALINAFAPWAPEVVGHVEGPEMARPAPFSGFVVAAAYTEGLRVIDLQGLTNPAILDVVLPARRAGAFASAGGLVHVVDTTDLGDPEDPGRNRLTVLTRGADGSLSEAAVHAPEAAIWTVVADGPYAAAAMYDEGIMFNSIEILDATDPTAPVVGARLGAKLSINFDVVEPHFRMEDGRMALSLEDTDDVLLYDISEGGVATQVGTYTPGDELVQFAVPGRELLAVAVRDGDTGWVELIDTRDPSAPVLASLVELPDGVDFPVTVEAEGSRMAILAVVIGGFNGPYTVTLVYDVSDPANPEIAAEPLPGGSWIALGAGILHTESITYPPSPTTHLAFDLAHLPEINDAESIGYIDVWGDMVKADGVFFGLSVGHLKFYGYGSCGPMAATITQPAELK